MRFLLEIDHYVDDRLLEKGSVIGDGEDAVHDWRYLKNELAINRKAGELRPLSRAMSPLDDEAKKALRLAFGEERLTLDPTASIPIQGTTNAPGLALAKAPPLMRK